MERCGRHHYETARNPQRAPVLPVAACARVPTQGDAAGSGVACPPRLSISGYGPLEGGPDVEGGLEARERVLEVGLSGEVPVELQAQEHELESHPVVRPSVDQLVLVRVPELEVLVLQRAAADVEKMCDRM